MNPTDCSCTCGATTFRTRAAPRFRMLCHCTLCQRFNDAPFADVLIYRARDVEMPPGTVEFTTLKPPPNVQRGKCASCGAPAIETFHAPLLPKLTMVPRAMHPAKAALPEPIAHFFYNTRIEDAADGLPKHQGYLASQLAFCKYLIAASPAGE